MPDGHALLCYAQLSPSPLSFYSLGTAEGTMGRTLSEISHGKIQSLSCRPNEENLTSFMAFGEPFHASFFLGPFHRLDKEHLHTQERLRGFAGGFDIVLEVQRSKCIRPIAMARSRL